MNRRRSAERRTSDANVARLLACAPRGTPAPRAVVARIRAGVLDAAPFVTEEQRLDAIVARAREGDSKARAELFSALYDSLHMLADASMRRQHPAHTLQATALVNEAYLKLSRREQGWESRAHFLAAAAKAMRWILVDHARTRTRRRRTATGRREPLRDALLALQDRSIDVLQLDAALRELESVDPEAARVVELRFFGKLRLPGVAKILGISLRSAERRWTFARAWLRAALDEGEKGKARTPDV